MDQMAQRIKELRKMHGLTLEQVGNVVGVGKSTVRKWEEGMITNMRRDKIASLAKVPKTTPAYLMGWQEENIPATGVDDGKLAELNRLLLQLSDEELQLVSSQIKGILSSR